MVGVGNAMAMATVPTGAPAASLCPTCPRTIVQSSSNRVSMAVSTVKLTQNQRQFFVGGLDARTILQYADVPFLDFDQDIQSFCDYTQNAIGTPLQKPHLWQRPLDHDRVTNLGSWLDADAQRCMPDGILLGERAEFYQEPCISLLPAASRLGTAYQLRVENRLSDGCANHGPFHDQLGRQIFQNRCVVEGCRYHEESTNPLQLID